MEQEEKTTISVWDSCLGGRTARHLPLQRLYGWEWRKGGMRGWRSFYRAVPAACLPARLSPRPFLGLSHKLYEGKKPAPYPQTSEYSLWWEFVPHNEG